MRRYIQSTPFSPPRALRNKIIRMGCDMFFQHKRPKFRNKTVVRFQPKLRLDEAGLTETTLREKEGVENLRRKKRGASPAESTLFN